VDFIRRHRGDRFFLYVPHNMPHVPLYCGSRFEGKTGLGLYADVMSELDWSVGEILGALRKASLEEDTVILFTSDNGPWSSYGNHAGRTPFRDAKGTGFDGGTRSPCIVNYPRQVRPGTVSNRAWCSIDVLPTFAHLAGAKLPANPIDGRNVWDLVAGRAGASNPHDFYAFGTGNVFEGVLSGDGKWKLHVPHRYRHLVSVGNDGAAGKFVQAEMPLSLFDMERDPYETTNVLSQYPDVAARMQGFAERHRQEFYPA
jgi:arylsulfatase A-like enzyme